MAEVSPRLGCGVYRVSAVRRTGPVCTGRRSGSALVPYSRTGEGLDLGQREVQSVSKRSDSEKLSGVRQSTDKQENWSLERDPFRFTRMHARKPALSLCDGLVLQDKLLASMLTTWTRGAGSFHPEAFRSHQQLRDFCTVSSLLVEQGPERPGYRPSLRGLKLNPDPAPTTRNYSWRTDSSSEDGPLLHRSRTAYYDVLKVSPGATQSQIKTAYYKQSFIYHPDKNPGSKEATQRFSEISEAYTVLGNLSLRRKYDRGILSQSDIRSAGRPPSKEPATRSTGSPQQQYQHRTRRFSQAGGRPMFDFEAFYQAHYGEQLQRERDMRARKQRMQEEQKESLSKRRQRKAMQLTVLTMLATAGLIIINLCEP
ncbi:dnaJ (Hsp40) homolog, subfamily C, member 30b [Mastacembelus armatus]|uniref:dnaJ (Hsp40) homolog, subfamily C, member 30b n=1 Tax=Mastacembelus armatus TaxID=205130 RepID=UPI000E45F110|nr:uncharacterized protein LOC113125499 [Mastacembelus armatus]